MKATLSPRQPIYLTAASMILTIAAAFSQTTFTLVDDTSLVNHWPGTDGLVGSADDVISGEPSTTNASAPNNNGTASYNAFDFGQGSVPDASLFPPDRQAITFLNADDTVTIDMDVAKNGGGPLILGWDLSGSEPFPGHGAYSAQITAVNSGSYNPGDRSFSQNIDFTANLAGGPSNSSDFDFSGTAYVIIASEFGTPTGNDYVDSVLIPIAQAMSADGLFFAMGSGTVPAADNFGFPEMGVTAGLFGLMADGTGPALPKPEIVLSNDSKTVIVSWPSSATSAVLESNTVLNGESIWTVHPGPYNSSEGQNLFDFEIVNDHHFFRLRTP